MPIKSGLILCWNEAENRVYTEDGRAVSFLTDGSADYEARPVVALRGEGPSAKQRATMIDWRLRPCADGHVLAGSVLGHPRLGDRGHVVTSLLLRVDFEKGEAETLNTIYKLS